MQFWFREMFGWFITIIIKNPIFVTRHYSIKKPIIGVSKKDHRVHLKSRSFWFPFISCSTHWSSLFTLPICSDGQMRRSTTDTKYFKHFFDSLTWDLSTIPFKCSLSCHCHGRPLPFLSPWLLLLLLNFWNHLRSARSLVDSSPWVHLVFAAILKTLLPSMKSCRKIKLSSSFFHVRYQGRLFVKIVFRKK